MESRPLVVVGAGVSGTAAAIEAARAGVQVTLIDENPIPASMAGLNVPQIFGQRFAYTLKSKALMLERVTADNEALAVAEAAGVDIQLGTCVWGAFRNSEFSRVLDGPQLGLADDERSWLIKYDRLIVAAGARDLGLAFAGWNLAGAMGANAADLLMNRYEASSSRCMVVMGTGNLGLNAARMALDKGIEVPAIVDVSSAVRGDEALRSELHNAGVQFYTSHTVRETVGNDGNMESVVLVEIDDSGKPVAGSDKVIAADTVCLAVGLVPNVELLSLLGCDLKFESELGGYVPDRDEWMRTSVDTVFVAGDAAGYHDGMVLDSEIARNQGRLAGIAAAESLGALDGKRALDRKADLQADAVDTVPNEVHSDWTRWLQSLAKAGGPDIFVCPCEEVTCAELLDLRPPRFLGWDSERDSRRSLRALAKGSPADPDQVKRLTRAGMGHCQGRLCREQVSMLLAHESGHDVAEVPFMSYRPPVRPLPLKVLWAHEETEQMRRDWPKWFSPTSPVLG
ncbi:MAG: FAD-dependent oxidoreductase [Chloroflexota bacterium]|nr:FAD-dependent oxidoreductase [Chloroflexota bacterium]